MFKNIFIVFNSEKYTASDIIRKLNQEHYQHIKLLGISTTKIFISNMIFIRRNQVKIYPELNLILILT